MAYTNTDPNNYAGSGMSQADFEKTYGTPDQQAGAANNAGATAASTGNEVVNKVNPASAGYTQPGGAGYVAPTTPTYGTNSDPGILQQWFGERANGTDPGYEYATGRGLTALNNQYAARGGFNSGASIQGDSDYLANMGSQREGQLDTLAGGASNENANQVSQMLGLGMGLAGGEGGLGAAYDTAGANAMSGANNAGLGYGAQGIGLQYNANKGLISNLVGAI